VGGELYLTELIGFVPEGRATQEFTWIILRENGVVREIYPVSNDYAPAA